MIKLLSIPVLAAAIVAATAAFAFSDDAAKADHKSEVKRPFYGNATCPMTGEKVDPATFLEKDGERVYFCCKNCVAKAADKIPAMYDKAYPADKVVETKNKSCPVMGEALDAEAKFVTIQGHKVGICCDGCDKKLRKGANHFLAVASDPNLVALNNKKCPTSGSDVNRNSSLIIDGVLVDFCCDKCVAGAEKDPATVTKALEADITKAKDAAAKKRESEKKDGEKKNG